MSRSALKDWRSMLPFALLIGAAAIIVLFSLRRDEQRGVEAPSTAAREPLYVAEQARWVRFDADGQPQLRAEAARIDYFDDRSMSLHTVRLDRLGGAQAPWQLQAARGEVPPGQSRMHLTPEVLISGAPKPDVPVTLTASDVWVDWRQRQIRSDAPVQAEAPGRRLQADAWQTDFEAAHTRLLGHVEVHYDAPQR